MAVRPNLAISLGLIAHLEALGPGSPVSADAETDFPDRGLAEHGDPVDPGTRWTLAAPRDDPLHRGRWTLQHRFHAPVGAVANPPGDSGFEGCRVGTALGTYLHGPLLPRNPALADWLLSRALQHGGGDGVLEPLHDELEQLAHVVSSGRARSRRGR